MTEYKVLTDNSALRRRLDRESMTSSATAIGIAASMTEDREPDLGEQRMMADFGLTSSELWSGLAGLTLDDWMFSCASENGIGDPASNPDVLRKLIRMKQLNADAHRVAYDEYVDVADKIVRSRLKVLWGSNMTGADYLRRNLDPTLMDWSVIDFGPYRSVALQRGEKSSHNKLLAPNKPSDDIFSLSGETSGQLGRTFAEFQSEKRRRRLEQLSRTIDEDDDIDDLFDD